MNDVSDQELLRDYGLNGSETAFAALVNRHINLVYSAALRHVNISAHAEEITQAVFVVFARKAASLRPDTILEAWLYETTRLTALRFLRGERRRQFREQEAYMQSIQPESTDAIIWGQLSPLLDEAMSQLGKKDREAVVLRFFKDKSLNEVATALQINEAAAQRRVHRAVEKLRKYFTNRGVSSTTAVITGMISAHSVQAAPLTLVKSVMVVAVAKGATASASTLTLINGALKIMAWTKAKTALVTGVILLATVSVTTVALKEFTFGKTASNPDVSSSGSLNETNPVEYYVLHTPLLQNNEQLRNDLVGTWKLVGAKSLKTGKFVVLAAGNRFYKTFTPADWSTASYDSNSNLLNSAGGPYTINGELCTETIATATGDKTRFLGARVPFRIRVIGDDYYQMGSGANPSVEQQWHRVTGTLSRSTSATGNIKGQLVGSKQLVDAGNATPEDAWETRYWARSIGDYDAVIAATAPEAVETAKAWMKDQATFRERSQEEFAAFNGIQILARKELADDRVELKYKFAFDNQPQTKIVTMVKLNGAWVCHETRAYDAGWDVGSQPELQP